MSFTEGFGSPNAYVVMTSRRGNASPDPSPAGEDVTPAVSASSLTKDAVSHALAVLSAPTVSKTRPSGDHAHA